MKSLLSVLALVFGALTFQSCEVYPTGSCRGYYEGGYYGGGGYYDGTGYYGEVATTGDVITALL